MRIDEATYKAMPSDLRALFVKLPNPGSDEVVGLFPYSKSGKSNGSAKVGQSGVNVPLRRGILTPRYDDGSAARFFYCAKANKKDRNEGLNGEANNHPTVKPTDLMRYLCRLITPPGGTVLDPFLGSGTTGKAALLEGFNFVGIEMEESYLDIAKQRIQQVIENQE
jgi:site-specific DNA-methyltransferase (adenine-specific)